MFEIHKNKVTKLLHYIFVCIRGLIAATYSDAVEVRK